MTRAFNKQYVRMEVEKWLKVEPIPAIICEHKAFGMNPAQKKKIRRQVAQVTGKKAPTHLKNKMLGQHLCQEVEQRNAQSSQETDV